MDDTLIDEKSFSGYGKMHAAKVVSISAEIERLPINRKLKDRIVNELSERHSNYMNMKKELYECHKEIELLEKAVLRLSKEVSKING